MMRALLAAIALTVTAQPCLAATKGSYVALHHEQRDGNRASGISVTAYDRGLALGISANKISSDKPLEIRDRTTIYPVYAFARLALQMPIAPYVEIGVDMGDYLLNESANESSSNRGEEQNKPYNVDSYGAIGIKTSLRRAPVDFAFYIKSYSLIFNDGYRYDTQAPDDTVITMSGANLIFNF